ncbi:hypothetical protein TNCV_1214151 [Trichonephila clavipes]|nr:hypothetical protein TNCV_1214151 [Trichonephila clavipes]
MPDIKIDGNGLFEEERRLNAYLNSNKLEQLENQHAEKWIKGWWYWDRTHDMPAMVGYLNHWATAAPSATGACRSFAPRARNELKLASGSQIRKEKEYNISSKYAKLGNFLISPSTSSCASASIAREPDKQILVVKINPQEKTQFWTL